jgi:hypothetical protein
MLEEQADPQPQPYLWKPQQQGQETRGLRTRPCIVVLLIKEEPTLYLSIGG